MNIIINGTDFWDGFDAMKYWAPPKSYDRQKWKQEIHEYMLSGQYIGARKVDGIWAMIIKDETAYLYTNKYNINVNAIAREYGGTDNYFMLRDDREYFSHMKLFSIEFLGYDRNKYYKEVVAKDKDEALYKFHRDNYGDVQRCEFVKYIYQCY